MVKKKKDTILSEEASPIKCQISMTVHKVRTRPVTPVRS